MKPFSIVVAMDEKNGIGKNGDLAWRLPADLKHFKEITTSVGQAGKINAVIMGRKTWDSLPEKFKPLPGRANVILSRASDIQVPMGVPVFSNLDQTFEFLELEESIENIFVIGGGQIFTEALKDPHCQKLYLTHLKGDFHCDTFFPNIPSFFKKHEESQWFSEGTLQYQFVEYRKNN